MINCSRGATLQNRANGGYFRGKARGCRESPSATLTAAAWLRWPAVTGCLDGFVVRIERGFQQQNGAEMPAVTTEGFLDFSGDCSRFRS